MNIFVLSYDPKESARMLCNKHVTKMLLETAQILCAARQDETPYRKTHVNHPCVKWAAVSSANYDWLLTMGLELSSENIRRYGKEHKSSDVVRWCAEKRPSFGRHQLTPFVMAMPEQYRGADVVESYRAYYINEKKYFARWKPRADAPSWWPYEETSTG